MEKRVGPLKRDSEKAQQFLELSEKRKTLEITLWVDAIRRANDSLRDQQRKYEAAQADYDRLSRQLDDFDAKSAALREEAQQLMLKVEQANANTVKDARGLAAARAYGVKRMTFDDESEIAKIAAYVPDAEVLVRIAVHNKRALVDLNTKFGAHPEDAIPLLQKAKAAGLNPVGICFHVGSQSLSTAAYEEALLFVHGLFDEAEAAGLPQRLPLRGH